MQWAKIWLGECAVDRCPGKKGRKMADNADAFFFSG